jgi:hypothetical protein
MGDSESSLDFSRRFSRQRWPNLREYLENVMDLHPNAKCVCLCFRITYYDQTSFRAYLRVFLPNCTATWFMIDKLGNDFMRIAFQNQIMNWKRFVSNVSNLKKYHCTYDWVPTNYSKLRYSMLWVPDQLIKEDLEIDIRDRLMCYPSDDNAYFRVVEPKE